MKITTTAFEPQRPIPTKYTCDGEDVNPELTIGDIPSEAKSLVLIVDDPDAPGKTWLHWLVYDIEPTTSISEDSVPGQEGKNDFSRTSYGGPCPPGGEHRYFFRLYALDTTLELGGGADRSTVEKAMDGHVLASAELMGTYSR
jgi:hypothetical protein